MIAPGATLNPRTVRLDPATAVGQAKAALPTDRRAPRLNAPTWEIQALVLEAIARDQAGDVAMAEWATSREEKER
jgi:hypothetical protein